VFRTIALFILAAVALATCSAAEARRPRSLRPIANPSAVVATEFAFATEAKAKGQWTAFRDYAADDAVMFVPQLVEARDWLKKQANPAQTVTWQPYSVWMSCDGSMAVSKGAWQRSDGTNGYFTTVWQRQKNGKYKWTLDQGDTLAQPLAAPEMISGVVADCSKPTASSVPAPPAGVVQRVGWSDDKTLQWIVDVRADGSRSFKANRWTGDGFEEAVRSDVGAK
jgi:hypothetical protein